MNDNKNNDVKKDMRVVWVVYFIGFDDAADAVNSVESHIEPRVGFERVETTEAQMKEDAEWAALLRGGQLIAVIDEDNAEKAKDAAEMLEKSILRLR